MSMRFLFIFTLFFIHVSFVEAHVPNLVSQPTLNDVYIIEDPTLSQAFYGTLKDFPHTYEIRASEPFTLFTQILVPDIDESKNTLSGIIIKLPESKGRVTEISRLSAKDASWESEYEPFGGDSYRKGAFFQRDLEPGTYRIEVHTPNNLEQYVLVVGTREEMTIGYFEMLRRLVGVKVFFGKSPIRIVESPFVYVPLFVLVCILAGWFVYRRNKSKIVTMEGDIL